MSKTRVKNFVSFRIVCREDIIDKKTETERDLSVQTAKQEEQTAALSIWRYHYMPNFLIRVGSIVIGERIIFVLGM